jgi:predicted enzyme related to lactoylglutathione lyase
MPPRASLNASLVFVNIPADDESVDATLRFYSRLLGSDDFARSMNARVTSFHRPISVDGVDLTVTERYDIQERAVPYFAVENLDQALAALQSVSGAQVRVLEPPSKIPAVVLPPETVEQSVPAPTKGRVKGAAAEPPARPLGRMAVILDPGGNHVGLIQLDDEQAQAYFKVGKHRRALGEREQQHRKALETTERVLGGRKSKA